MDLTSLKGGHYALAPEIVLTPQGPQRDHVIVVEGGRLRQVGPLSAYKGTTQTLAGRAAIPGFIDTHTHLGQTFGKALIGGEPSQIWRRIWTPMEGPLGPEGHYISAKWQMLEALRGGYTGLVNYALNDATKNDAVHRAAKETGIRLVSAMGLDEIGTDADGRECRFPLSAILEQVEALIAQCRASDRLSPSICCTSFFNNTPGTLGALAAFCAKHKVLLQIHSNEHFPEVHDCIIKFGKRPIELFADSGVLGPHLLLHHVTLPSEKEIELLRNSGTAISYNPVASQWKGNAVAPAVSYAERSIRMGLGSDNTRLDGFRTLDAAESCQRVAHGMRVIDFSCGAAWTWVDAATRGAADACGLGDTTGSLVAGQAADFLILDMNRPETVPSWDFEWELVRYYNRDQIDAVVVAGEPVLQGGRPTGWDDRAFMAEYTAFATRVGTHPDIVRRHGPSTQYRPR
jgi:cytosine/adenosine deaminase-related metal-dependent hydrolase